MQWHRVLDQALRDRPVVGVADAVRDHLGRIPTRSELSAARRAAHRYAATGQAQLTTLRATTVGGRTAQVLVLAEPGIDLTDVTALRRKVAAHTPTIDKPQGHDVKDTAARVERMLSQIHTVSRAAPLLPLDQIAPAHAKLLAEDLTEALANLAVLAANLTRRSRLQQPIRTGRDQLVSTSAAVRSSRSRSSRNACRCRPACNAGSAATSTTTVGATLVIATVPPKWPPPISALICSRAGRGDAQGC